MSTYCLPLWFLWWLLALTFLPAIAVSLLCVECMVGFTRRKGLWAGLVGIARPMGWYWLEGWFLPPVPRATVAWAICHLWKRRASGKAAKNVGHRRRERFRRRLPLRTKENEAGTLVSVPASF